MDLTGKETGIESSAGEPKGTRHGVKPWSSGSLTDVAIGMITSLQDNSFLQLPAEPRGLLTAQQRLALSRTCSCMRLPTTTGGSF